MPHDDDEKCYKNYAYRPSTIMNAAMFSFYSQYESAEPWSECSVHKLGRFIASQRSHCIGDVPQLFMVRSRAHSLYRCVFVCEKSA